MYMRSSATIAQEMPAAGMIPPARRLAPVHPEVKGLGHRHLPETRISVPAEQEITVPPSRPGLAVRDAKSTPAQCTGSHPLLEWG